MKQLLCFWANDYEHMSSSILDISTVELDMLWYIWLYMIYNDKYFHKQRFTSEVGGVLSSSLELHPYCFIPHLHAMNFTRWGSMYFFDDFGRADTTNRYHSLPKLPNRPYFLNYLWLIEDLYRSKELKLCF